MLEFIIALLYYFAQKYTWLGILRLYNVFLEDKYDKVTLTLNKSACSGIAD